MLFRASVTALLASGLPLAAADASFHRIPVGPAIVSVCREVPPAGQSRRLWLHLHGATATVEQAFARIGAPGVLVTLTLPGLSKVYADHFADPSVFDSLLREVAAAMRGAGAGPDWTPGELTVSSFSAGFGGVRQLLRQPAAFDRITTLVMADSIYCGYAEPAADRRVDPGLMEGFVRFARLAAEGKKRMLITHSEQVPAGYASTTETADYLLAAVGAQRAADPRAWDQDLHQLSIGRQGQFEVTGFAGREAADHLRHLRSLGAFLDRVRYLEAGPGSPPDAR